MAATVLTSAAKVKKSCQQIWWFSPLKQYEALLKAEKCSDDAQRRAMMVAKAMYYLARMEAVSHMDDHTSRIQPFFFQAWKEGNQTVADFMLRKITGIDLISRT